jgi:hypothetical protein
MKSAPKVTLLEAAGVLEPEASRQASQERENGKNDQMLGAVPEVGDTRWETGDKQGAVGETQRVTGDAKQDRGRGVASRRQQQTGGDSPVRVASQIKQQGRATCKGGRTHKSGRREKVGDAKGRATRRGRGQAEKRLFLPVGVWGGDLLKT